MTRKQWQCLMAAGLFSAALMANVVYGENTPVKPEVSGSTATASSSSPKKKRTVKHRKAKKKDVAPTNAASAN